MIESLVPAGSSYAGEIDLLVNLILWIVGFWFVLCEVVFFWLIFRFRKKEGVPGQYISGEEKSQKRWITIPHVLVLVCDIFILVGAIWVWYDIKQELPPAQAEVRIISQQWAWTFVHPGADGKLGSPDDIYKVNELRLQKDMVYHYHLEATDVMHDFSVPVFRLKQDAIPGRIITGWFTPTMTGEFDIQCAELCGIGHGLMPARLIVEDAAAHSAWVAEQTPLQVAALPARVGKN